MGIYTAISGHMARRSELMSRMMAAMKVDLATASSEPFGLQLDRTARSCLFCRHEEACSAWLDRAETTGEKDGPAFCPNRPFFAAHRL